MSILHKLLTTCNAFVKMHASGNSFIIMNEKNVPVEDRLEYIQRIADPHLGIGCDQFILIKNIVNFNSFFEQNYNEKNDNYKEENIDIANKYTRFYVEIFNADASEVSLCVNIVRAFGKIMQDSQETYEIFELVILCNGSQKILRGKRISFDEIETTIYGCTISTEGLTEVIDIGNKNVIHLLESEIKPEKYNLNHNDRKDILDEQKFNHGYNDNFFASEKISLIPSDSYNISYVFLMSKNAIAIKTIERGVGEVWSCGSGIMASVAFCVYKNLFKHGEEILVYNKGSVNNSPSIVKVDFVNNTINSISTKNRIGEFIAFGNLQIK